MIEPHDGIKGRTAFSGAFKPPYSVLEVDLEKGAQMAYQNESDVEGIDLANVPLSRRCRTVAVSMLLSLFKINKRYEEVASLDTRIGYEVDTHRYLVIDRGADGELVADPTWKQFVPEKNMSSDLPDLLIGLRPEVIAIAGLHGVSSSNQLLWEPRSAVAEPPRFLTPAERIADFYDKQ